MTSQANSNSPSSRFPTEVLIEVFISLKRQYEANFSDQKRLEWVVVTHVCQRWRDVALGCGTLWSSIRNGDPAIAEWLKRSGGSALFVQLTIARKADLDTFTLVLQKLSQIQSLTIQIASSIKAKTYRKFWSNIVVMLAKPAPVLMLFELKDTTSFLAARVYPLQLFADNAPVLRKLKLEGCSPVIPSPFFDHLTNLSVSHASPQLNSRDLLVALHDMPSLQFLTLGNALGRDEPSTSDIPIDQEDVPVVHLPQVKLLSFGGPNFDTDLNFLSHLSLSTEASVMFLSSLQTADLTAFPRFIEIYNRVRDNPPPVQVLTVSWNNKKLQLVASNPFRFTVGVAAHLTLVLGGPWDEDKFPISWGEHLVKLPLEELELLQINCKIGDAAWAEMSRKSQTIHTVSLPGVVADEFIWYLVQDYNLNCLQVKPSMAEDGPHTFSWDNPAFRTLQTIEVCHCDLEGQYDFIEVLALALYGRVANSDNPFIKNFVLHQCENVSPAMIRKLRQVVNVHLDREEFPKFVRE